ncbi:caffeate O-methyltransferase [Salvia divinorum]|uniref:Caffeate O-methyltransferase n=1 Tax=Salvia divinorum TaxID=28513 RepID=A0ABD1FIA2_SALDI
MSTEEEAHSMAIQYATSVVLPMVVKAAAELDLFQLIENAGDISAAELAAQLPTSNPGAAAMLNRILRLLTAHSLLSCEGGDERRYALSAVGKFFTKANASIFASIMICHTVIQQAPSYTGIEHVGGDMFVSVPKGDAILMKLYYDNPECVTILRNCKEALPKNGKVIIVEYILLETPESGAAVVEELLNVAVSAYNPGGKERTESEFRILGEQAGFRGFRKVCAASGLWFMEFYDL